MTRHQETNIRPHPTSKIKETNKAHPQLRSKLGGLPLKSNQLSVAFADLSVPGILGFGMVTVWSFFWFAPISNIWLQRHRSKVPGHWKIWRTCVFPILIADPGAWYLFWFCFALWIISIVQPSHDVSSHLFVLGHQAVRGHFQLVVLLADALCCSRW